MKKNRRIFATLFLLVLTGAVLWFAADRYYSWERKEGFERLTGYTEQVGREIRDEISGDRIFLERIADMIAGSGLEDMEETKNLLLSLGDTGMISRLELLLPGDRIITGEGEADDMTGLLSFQEEAARGPHVSRRCVEKNHSDKQILRHYVPVKRNGETVAVLCGIVELDRMPGTFSAVGYENGVQLYIVEGKTGNFLQDTWHNNLGNVSDLGNRRTKKGYSWEGFNADLARGEAGTIVFLSKTAGEYFYTSYAPVGVEDWMIILNVTEADVFSDAENILHSFYESAVLLFSLFIVYFIWMIFDIRQEKAASDKQLRNVSYMLNVEKELSDVHMKPEHFVTALQKVADFLTAETAFFWLAEGQPDIGRRIWSSREEQDVEQDAELTVLFPELFSRLKEKDGFLSYNMLSAGYQYPSVERKIAHDRVRSLMLLPVSGLDEEPVMILGACNLEHRWENTECLRQISLSFSMAVSHYGTYLALRRMGQIDSLTGLMNRNSYHAALDAVAEKDHAALACVYVDANGLHEMNNHLGHQAGDEMLRTTANVLKRVFRQSDVYRIGGDEFVVLCFGMTETDVHRMAGEAREELAERGYGISLGIGRSGGRNINAAINMAEEAMRQDKKQYYAEGRERQLRMLDRKMEQLIVEKQDADAFLSVLAPDFKGVYFVDLNRDAVRHLFIPPYFEQILKEEGDIFSRALLTYARRIVMPEHYQQFEKVCDYDYLAASMERGETPEFNYQKTDGTWLRLRILKFKNYTSKCRETLWIFNDHEETHLSG